MTDCLLGMLREIPAKGDFSVPSLDRLPPRTLRMTVNPGRKERSITATLSPSTFPAHSRPSDGLRRPSPFLDSLILLDQVLNPVPRNTNLFAAAPVCCLSLHRSSLGHMASLICLPVGGSSTRLKGRGVIFYTHLPSFYVTSSSRASVMAKVLIFASRGGLQSITTWTCARLVSTQRGLMPHNLTNKY